MRLRGDRKRAWLPTLPLRENEVLLYQPSRLVRSAQCVGMLLWCPTIFAIGLSTMASVGVPQNAFVALPALVALAFIVVFSCLPLPLACEYMIWVTSQRIVLVGWLRNVLEFAPRTIRWPQATTHAYAFDAVDNAHSTLNNVLQVQWAMFLAKACTELGTPIRPLDGRPRILFTETFRPFAIFRGRIFLSKDVDFRFHNLDLWRRWLEYAARTPAPDTVVARALSSWGFEQYGVEVVPAGNGLRLKHKDWSSWKQDRDVVMRAMEKV